jgi:hypothetical protein
MEITSTLAAWIDAPDESAIVPLRTLSFTCAEIDRLKRRMVESVDTSERMDRRFTHICLASRTMIKKSFEGVKKKRGTAVDGRSLG